MTLFKIECEICRAIRWEEIRADGRPPRFCESHLVGPDADSGPPVSLLKSGAHVLVDTCYERERERWVSGTLIRVHEGWLCRVFLDGYGDDPLEVPGVPTYYTADRVTRAC